MHKYKLNFTIQNAFFVSIIKNEGILKIVFHIFSLIFLANFCQAQINISYLDSPPKIDGKSDDWQGISMNSFQSKANTVISKNKAKYAFGFDEEHLYGIFQVFDKQLTDLALDKSGSPRIAFNDGIEVYIDAKNDSKSRMDMSDYQIVIDINGCATVYRGGDRFLLQVEKFKVPKDTITNNFILETAAQKSGTINNEIDIDEGYFIEFSLPWASLGISPVSGTTLKMDVCFNDADKFLDIKPLHESESIPNYGFESITGNTDFGFPDKWVSTKLKGHASVCKQFNEKFGHFWWIFALCILLFFVPFLSILIVRNKKLRQVKAKKISTNDSFQKVLKEEIQEGDVFAEQAKGFIVNDLDKDVSSIQLAKALAMSVRQMQRIFKEKLDTTPTAFITSVKMEEAAKMLKSSQKNIAEVAYAVGFTDPAYFAKVFRKYFNQSPKDYSKPN